MGGMEIREATMDDLPRIVKLMAEDTLGRSREDFSVPLKACYVEAFKNICEDKNSILLVACENGEVVGSLQVTFTQYLSHEGSRRATIENVHVFEKCRNRGVGTQLMCHAISLAKDEKCSIVQLTSNKSRKDAHRFYERIGFRATHEGMKLSLERC